MSVEELQSHVCDGLMRLNRHNVIPGPGLIEAAKKLLGRAPRGPVDEFIHREAHCAIVHLGWILHDWAVDIGRTEIATRIKGAVEKM